MNDAPLPPLREGHSATRYMMVRLGLIAMMWVSACCSTRAGEGTNNASGPASEVPAPVEPGAGAPSTPGGGPEGPETRVKPPDDDLAERCAAARDFTAFSPEEARAWREECRPAFDCARPLPLVACCAALIPACTECSERSARRKAAFDYACFGETTPLPDTVDCAAPPPLSACCKALIPKCLDCVAKNRYFSNLYDAQCRPQP